MSLPSGCLEPFSGGFLDARLAFSTDSIGFLFFSQGRSWEGNRSRCFQARDSGGDLQTSRPCALPGQAGQRGRAEEELSALSPKG